jgi:hypothetical protein
MYISWHKQDATPNKCKLERDRYILTNCNRPHWKRVFLKWFAWKFCHTPLLHWFATGCTQPSSRSNYRTACLNAPSCPASSDFEAGITHASLAVRWAPAIQEFCSLPTHTQWLWKHPGRAGRSVKLTTDLHSVPRIKLVELSYKFDSFEAIMTRCLGTGKLCLSPQEQTVKIILVPWHRSNLTIL